MGAASTPLVSFVVRQGEQGVGSPPGTLEGAVRIPEGEGAVRIPGGEGAVRTLEGEGAVRTPEGGGAVRSPEGEAAVDLSF